MGGQRTGIRNPGNGPGREPKLTREKLDSMVTALACGLSIKGACRVNDITDRTHENWMKSGEADAAAGENSIHAEYFRLAGKAEEVGKLARRKLAWDLINKTEAKPDDIARAKAAMQFEAMVEGGKMGVARRRALRMGLREDGTPAMGGAPPAEESARPVELSRLSQEEFARWQYLSAKMRGGFDAMPLEEVAEAQRLLRKAKGEDLPQPAPGGQPLEQESVPVQDNPGGEQR